MKTCLFLVLASASMLASAAPGDAFAKPQRLVDIGGRKLNLYCSGSGAPTVVFEAQSGSAGRVWWDVQPKVAARTRACAYDRSGFGFSAATPRQADLASSELYDACIGGVTPSFPKTLGSVDLQQRRTPAYWKAMRAEQQALPAGLAQLRAARTSFGDLPLIVLARGVSPYAVPGQPQSDLNKATELANFTLQAETATLSKQGKVVVVAGAGHVVQETHPQAVVAAVDDVVERVRQGAK